MAFSPKDESHEHATLSASGTYRWWNCPGSVHAESQVPDPPSSIYAAEGTAAHSLASSCLTTGMDAIELMGRFFDGFEVDDEMAEAVQVYVDVCRGLIDRHGRHFFVERRFNLSALNPPVPMFGTSDFSIISRDGRHLTIADLKYGKGIMVSAEGNLQLKYYALGVLLAFSGAQFETVETIIVQPRGQGNPVKSATYTAAEIRDWSVELMERAHATMERDAALVPGSHCRFCKISGRCAAQADAAFAVAQMDFAEASEADTLSREPVSANQLTPLQLSRLLSQIDVLEEFARGARATAQHLIESGVDIPDWKVVPKRPSRKWENEETVPFNLELTGIPTDKLWAKKVVSPKQAEEALAHVYRGQGMKSGAAKSAAKQSLESLIVSSSSGGTLERADDERPALPIRGSEFAFDDPRPVPPGHGTEFDFEKLLPARVNPAN